MAISFSGNAKAEIAKVIPQKNCCAVAECFGILLFCNSFHTDSIRIITESREFAAILPKLFKKAFNVAFDILPEGETSGKMNFQITNKENIRKVMEAYGFDVKTTTESSCVTELVRLYSKKVDELFGELISSLK